MTLFAILPPKKLAQIEVQHLTSVMTVRPCSIRSRTIDSKVVTVQLGTATIKGSRVSRQNAVKKKLLRQNAINIPAAEVEHRELSNDTNFARIDPQPATRKPAGSRDGASNLNSTELLQLEFVTLKQAP
ncbi:hypothetical protein GPALN_002243 [Globodera pallida]|nr:hypothetical protein GPALN_002243 [Globodera pallida]